MNFKLRSKLLLGFIAVAIIGTIIGVFGIWNMKQLDNADTFLYEKATLPIADLNMMTTEFLWEWADLSEAIFAEQSRVIEIEKGIVEYRKNFAKYAEEYKKTFIDKNDEEIFNKYLGYIADYYKKADELMRLIKENKKEEAITFYGKLNANEVKIADDENTKLTDLNMKAAKDTSDNNTKLANQTSVVMISVIFIGLIVSIFLAIWIGVYIISKPLMKISDTLKNSSGQISTASIQLSSSSQEIANGATEQASSIEETTSSMEELASMVKQNVGNAQEASTLADKAADASQSGHNQMEGMLSSMNDINKSSEQIKKVIKVIDDIAFQTNILALNAAVEAARAGEAGMGFAVVADEVKNLANKSAEAAKETANMIEDSIKKTELGLQTATKLGESFKEILTNAKKVAEMSKEVETASKQQDSGINQVNKAIVQFDEVVQANASSAEETASSAEELQAQVEALNDIVSKLIVLVTGKLATIEEQTIKHKIIEHKTSQLNQLTNQFTKHVDIKKKDTLKQGQKQLTETGTATLRKKKEFSPEQVIPFEEDEQFKDIE